MSSTREGTEAIRCWYIGHKFYLNLSKDSYGFFLFYHPISIQTFMKIAVYSGSSLSLGCTNSFMFVTFGREDLPNPQWCPVQDHVFVHDTFLQHFLLKVSRTLSDAKYPKRCAREH
ncbi:hypothetical protein CEXT_697691 [Caerostris extrusa]|uniref:Uncharacterized protein n=1 Tax=Caerostris extrusa TaxID=172846 RepID=A0AAV4QP03_CAEEX|nr:hypothetical protein CEXT_697691 [Caerostris extrusa]